MTNDIGRFSSSDTETPVETPVEEQKPAELVYGSAEEFLHEQLLPTYVRDVDGRAAKWCLEWYYHQEAVTRVEALWRAWEHLRLDGATGISVWFKDHADHPMSVLLEPRQAPVCDRLSVGRFSQEFEPSWWLVSGQKSGKNQASLFS